jgi:hypothetical protein
VAGKNVRRFFSPHFPAVLNQGNRDAQPSQEFGNTGDLVVSLIAQSAARIFFDRFRLSMPGKINAHQNPLINL